MINKRYGVGFGPALFSRRTGRLTTALRELRRLIEGGVDPRTVTIVPAVKCHVCKGQGEFMAKGRTAVCLRCNGFKFVTEGREIKIEDIAETVTYRNRDVLATSPPFTGAFMSKPATTAADRRTWLIRIPGESIPCLVRVYPPDGMRTIKPVLVCDCRREGACAHKRAARVLDDQRFKIGENNNV